MPAPTELYCHVQTPKGSALAKAGTGVERGPTLVCPVDDGYFPDTIVEPGGPLEAIVCVSQPGTAGGTVRVRPIALVRPPGGRGYGEIVLCVPLDDPAWRRVDRRQDIPADLRQDIERFIAARQAPEDATATVTWCSRDDALTAIDDAAARWAATVNGRG